MVKIKVITLFLLFTVIVVKAQDPIFSQSSIGNVNLNPALAGNDSCARLAINHRNQWPNLSSNFVTSSSNFYQYIPKLNSYAGITYSLDDQARGTLQTSVASLFYSQNINIKKVLIRPSLEIAFGTLNLDITKLNFGNVIDQRRGYVWNSQTPIRPKVLKNYLDFNLGTIIYFKNILVGVSAHHITQPDVGLSGSSKLPLRFGAQLGYQINLKKISIAPYAYFMQQQNFQMITVGTNITLVKHLNLGTAYRSNDVIIFNIGYQNKWLAFTYSYDMTMSDLSSNAFGSHEVGLAFKFWKVTPKKRLVSIGSAFS